MRPQVHPYLFIIFFATLFEYNLHRLITILTNPDALNDEKHSWVKRYPIHFYALVAISMLGFMVAVALAKREVILTLAPLALITILYSMPFFKNSIYLYRLRDIPFLKIFLIAFVWSSATILLPIIQSGQVFDKTHVGMMLLERFFFVFAITIPFDIRDMEVDRQHGLKTLPLLVGKKMALGIANGTLAVFILLCLYHYSKSAEPAVLLALVLSSLIALVFINNKELSKLPYYHYGLLDGTMLLQGLLVLASYYIHIH
jgi:4-hydroxybenzoate polyprenyltransferase